jgi:hypothetical protein
MVSTILDLVVAVTSRSFMILSNFIIASLPLDIRLFISLPVDPSLVIIVPKYV